MSESTLVTYHINILNTLFSQLNRMGYKVNENKHAKLLLQSLSNSYDQLVINLTKCAKTSLIFNDVAAYVLKEEMRYKK